MPPILVTGPPGTGKTTLARRVAERLAAEGWRVSGFVTEEIRRAGRRTGFTVRGLASGLERTLAVAAGPGPRVGRYGVDVAAFEDVALPELEAGIDVGDVLVVDEIGRMELYAPAFVALLPGVLGAPRVLATMHVHRHPVTDALRVRKDVEVVRIGPANRDALADILTAKLRPPG